MSVQSRAPARPRPGAPHPRLRRWCQVFAVTAGAAAALGLVLTAGPAASAATHAAAPAAPLHTYHVAPNGTDAATCEQPPIGNKDQRGDSRNATTRGACDIGAYDTGGA